MNKKNLRAHCKNILQKISQTRRKEASLHLSSTFCNQKGFVLSFASIKQEIDLWELNQNLAQKGNLILPRVESHGLKLFFVQNLKDMILSPWGILEPNPQKCSEISPDLISLALVPGLGFDPFHHRIGYGKGYYDRLLPSLLHAEKIGVGFWEQKMEEKIPNEPTDYPLDSLVLS